MPNSREVSNPEQRHSQPCRLSVSVEEPCSRPGAQLCPLLAPNMDILFLNPSVARTLRAHPSLHFMPAAHLWHFMAPPDPGGLAGWDHLFPAPIPQITPIQSVWPSCGTTRAYPLPRHQRDPHLLGSGLLWPGRHDPPTFTVALILGTQRFCPLESQRRGGPGSRRKDAVTRA